MSFMEWVQRRLVLHGFDPGVIDGEWGRNTRRAVIEFQQARGLKTTGSLNPATLRYLRRSDTSAAAPAPKDDMPKRDLLDSFPWMELALRKRGLHEGRDNENLRAWLKSDGKTLGDPAQLPWCGDFVETCVALTLPDAIIPGNPYLARNWLKFGTTVDPCFGAVMVFWRKSRSGTAGHVGFYYSEDETHYHTLGGNQSNSVNVSSMRKDRFLGARMPTVGGPYPRQVVTSSKDWDITENEF